MTKYQETEQKTSFSFTDYETVREGMKKFKLTRINGKLQGAWEQYLASKNIISFDENGRWMIINPTEMTRQSEIKSKMDWKDHEEMKTLFAQNPEEHEAWVERVSKFGESCRAIVNKMKIAV